MHIKVHTKVVLVRPDGRILIVRRSKDDERRADEWDFPGGGVEPGENPTAGAVREVLEEVGITLPAESLTLFYAATEPYVEGGDSNTRIMYLAHIADEQADSIVLSDEHYLWDWKTPDEVIVDFPHPVYVVGIRYALENGIITN